MSGEGQAGDGSLSHVTAVWALWASTLSPPCRSPGAAVPLGVLHLLPDHLCHLHQPDP